jgi:hypothetical protein
VRELVIVIPDLYLPPHMQAARDAAVLRGLAGIEYLARYGTRARLASGWLDWTASVCGRDDLIGAAPARLAAAALPAQAREHGGTLWLATPVHLSAGLARVHLEHQGLLALTQAELAQLAREFGAAFGDGGFALAPAACHELLLQAPEALAGSAPEPARQAGAPLAHAAPQGPQGAPLRRLAAEIEMWLHNGSLNEQRVARGALPVTTLWLWGEAGASGPFAARAGPPRFAGFGCDARLAGLMRLEGGGLQALPEELAPVLEADAERAMVVLHVGSELQETNAATLAEALIELDMRYVVPALEALGAGRIRELTLIANDRALRARRFSRLRLWRRPRFGLEGLT